MIVLNLAEWLRVTEASIRLAADTDCNEKWVTTAGKRIMRMFVFLVREESDGKIKTLVTV